MAALEALGSGFIGTVAMTATHEVLRHLMRDAPRLDQMGERAVASTIRAVGFDPPPDKTLYPAALAGDLLANSLYYSMVGLAPPAAAPLCGAMLGLTAGLGAVSLPGPLGLGTGPSARSKPTQAMTLGLYLLGGVVAGLVCQAMAGKQA